MKKKRPFIKGRIIKDFYKVGGYTKISRLENGIKVVDEIPFTVKKEWITNESFTEKANEIYEKVNKKYRNKFSAAKNDDELEKIGTERDAEYFRRLNKWFYPEKNQHGRPEGSQNKNNKIGRKDFKELFWDLYVKNGIVNQKTIAEKLGIGERTLRDYVKSRFNLKWKSFCKQVISESIQL